MAMTDTVDLMESMRRLFPNLDSDAALAELLLERAQRNLVRYQADSRRFSPKYGQDFDSFRQVILTSEPDESQEQDYFDWELAVTGVVDMQDEIARLSSMLES